MYVGHPHTGHRRAAEPLTAVLDYPTRYTRFFSNDQDHPSMQLAVSESGVKPMD